MGNCFVFALLPSSYCCLEYGCNSWSSKPSCERDVVNTSLARRRWGHGGYCGASVLA